MASTEEVVLHLPIAGPTSRMLAYGIDYMLVLVAQIGLFVLLVLALPAVFEPLAQVARGFFTSRKDAPLTLAFVAVFLVLQLVIEFTYFVLCERTMGGRSFGKSVLDLRVVRDDGGPPSLADSLTRNLLRVADVLPASYLVGLVAVVASQQGKRLGDLAAGTLVVRLEKPSPVPFLETLEQEGPAHLRFDREQVARVGGRETTLIAETLRRKHTLPPERWRAALAQTVAVVRARIGYGPVACEEYEAFLRALLRARRIR